VTICQSMSNDKVFISSQGELDAELSRFPWHDSFIREAHALSPTYVVAGKRQVVAPDSPWAFRLLVCSADSQHPGLEFVFEEVDQVALSSMVDLEPHGVVGVDEVILFLTAVDPMPIRAKRLRIRHLGAEVWGLSLRYCSDNLFDEGGFPVE
jgi:hypothetical protein